MCFTDYSLFLPDERQFEALSNIITGEAGGGPFAIYASTIEEFQNPKEQV